MTPTLSNTSEDAWQAVCRHFGWRELNRGDRGEIIAQCPMGSVHVWNEDEIIAAHKTIPAIIPDASRSHLGNLFLRDLVEPESYDRSQGIWSTLIPGTDKRGPDAISDIMTPSGWAWFCADRTTDLPLSQTSGKPITCRRLLKRDGMRQLHADDDLLILSLSDDGIIDMVRACLSPAAMMRIHGLSESDADERLGRALEAAYDSDQEDYGTTGTACFLIPSGARAREFEMG
jgi:hypothetical protein